MMGVPPNDVGTLVGGVIRETVIMRSKTAFQMSISEASFTTSLDSAR